MPAGAPPSPTLEIPRKSVELEDPGAHELPSANESGDPVSTDVNNESLEPPLSPIPTTRVEKIDTSPSHGEVPGTPAYNKRTQDAVPDEIVVVSESLHSRSSSRGTIDPPLSPGGTPIPRTRVEKVDPTSPSYGEVPGTDAYDKRRADALPDAIAQAPAAPVSDPKAAQAPIIREPRPRNLSNSDRL